MNKARQNDNFHGVSDIMNSLILLTIRFLDSKPFTFLVGQEKRAIVIQGSLFKGISEPLYNRTPDHGNWQSDGDEIADIKWEVFAALVEYAYTGTYLKSIRESKKKLNSTSNKQGDDKGSVPVRTATPSIFSSSSEGSGLFGIPLNTTRSNQVSRYTALYCLHLLTRLLSQQEPVYLDLPQVLP